MFTKKPIFRFFIVLFVILMMSGAASASPQLAPLGTSFTYQGKLIDGGVPANGTYDLQFKLFDALSSGSQVGSTITQRSVNVSNGLFTVQLDFGNVFNGTALYLEIGVRPGSSSGEFTTLTPLQPMSPTPYALYSSNSGLLNGLNDASFALTGHAHWGETWSGSGTGLTLNGGTIGLSSYGSIYGVSGSSTNGTGVAGTSNSSYGIYGTGYTGVYGSGSTYGVQGSSTSGLGVSGSSTSGIGTAGTSNSSYGVYGSGNTGVYGSGNTGVYGSSTTGEGVSGTSLSSNGVHGYGYNGVYGYSNSTGGAGIYGYAYGGTGNYAGYFQGNVVVNGNQTATGTKSAVVKTQDYGTRSLYTVESPENWFQDFGTGQLTNGSTVITIDPVFSETVNLADDYHVFLTPMGDCALYVTDKTPATFNVKALGGQTCSIAFDYNIVAKRLGYETVRLAVAEPLPAVGTPNK